MSIQQSLTGRGTNPTAFSIPSLQAGLQGTLIAPGDPEYDQARTVFWGGVDRRPAAILRVWDAADVSRAVSLARETGLNLAIRSGGHSIAGHSVVDGGIVLDLSNMKDLQIDLERRIAWAETGMTSGEYTTAVNAYSLATGFGDTGSVGIGGITLGGGIGYLVRKHGLTIDNLLAAELVTADGQLLCVDAESHPDLFWAIRGGGGNFGVATRFVFRLHEVDTILGGVLVLPATPDVIAGFVAEAEAAPDELSTIVNIMRVEPGGPFVVEALMVYAGEVEEGQRVLAPFRALAAPFVDKVRRRRYPEMVPSIPADVHPIEAMHTMFVNVVDHSVAEMILSYLQSLSESRPVVQLRVLGGAMSRVPRDATAFAHRGSRILVGIVAPYEHPDEKATHETWVNDLAGALRQSDGGAYVSFLGDEGEARVRAAYPGQTWDRLVRIKRRYDPTNFFRINQNIPPMAKES
jgi:FAD/FMN-containing dehydrogenase